MNENNTHPLTEDKMRAIQAEPGDFYSRLRAAYDAGRANATPTLRELTREDFIAADAAYFDCDGSGMTSRNAAYQVIRDRLSADLHADTDAPEHITPDTWKADDK